MLTGAVAGLATAYGCGPTARTSAIRILVGSGAGSASDTVARLFAGRLEARFDLRVSIENEGRAGGKLAAERLAQARPDGTTLAFLPTGLLYASILQEPGVRWNLADFGWIGSFNSDRRVLVTTARSGLKSFTELLRRPRPLLVSAPSASSASYYEPLIVNHLTGSRLKPVPGFVGGARNLALISGEVDGLVASLDGLAGVLELEGSRVILRLNDLPAPGWSAAPTLGDFARGPEAPVLSALLGAHARLGRIAALPPGAASEALGMWRTRFQRVVADEAFRSAAQARGHPIEATPGQEVAQSITGLLGTGAPQTRAALRRALSCGLAVAHGRAGCAAG